MKIVSKTILASVGIASLLGAAAPANAYYVIYWYNSYGNGYSYHCDDGTVTRSEGAAFIGQAIPWMWEPEEISGHFCPPE